MKPATSPPGITNPHDIAALHRLSNGRYAACLTASGSGYSEVDGIRLTAWEGDPTEDRDGFFIYLRDNQNGRFWSVGRMPAGFGEARYSARFEAGRFVIEHVREEIDARLEVAVSATDPLEVRRLRLVNRSTRPRVIEVTSCLEVVLNSPVAHAGHPVFSRLFLQTEALPHHCATLARRRPRSPEERYPVLVHALVGADSLEFETDRARFVGRGRTLISPRALRDRRPLSGTAGDVLDPVLALRTLLEIPPGGQAEVSFLLGAAGEEEIGGLLERNGSVAGVERILAQAAGPGPKPGDSGGESVDPARQRGPAPSTPPPVPAEARAAVAPPAEALEFFNGYGGFAGRDGEYVIRLSWSGHEGLKLPPRPWINVLANDSFGSLVSETGAGCTWNGNSREHRLTPWANDPVSDPPGEAFFVRDEATGEFWSPLPGPAPLPVDQEMRHGFGWSRASVSGRGLAQETTIFVDRDEPYRATLIRLLNSTDRLRRLSLYACYRLVLGHRPEESAAGIVTGVDAASGALLARRPGEPEAGGPVTFAALVTSGASLEISASGDRRDFLGPWGRISRPDRVATGGPLNGRTGAGLDPALIQRVTIEIEPGGRAEVAFLFGEGRDIGEARSIIARLGTIQAVRDRLEAVRAFWREGLSAVRVSSPSPALDRMMNGWLPYQTLACRIRGRSALYQSGGAYGFRDQLQDAASLVWIWPQLTREQIRRNAAHQFREGDVLHWWHPPGGRGLRTRFADDLLWLPLLTAFYVGVTGDRSVLDDVVPFLTARPLEPGEDEALLEPSRSAESADVYEHGARAIDRSLAVGAHGLPLFGTGDWNDGMNRVGRLGRGESVWMGFFLHEVLRRYAPLAAARGDDGRAARWRAHMEELALALNDAGWDGDWYRRGWYDSGAPLGSKESDECRIDALAQAWAVISGIAPADRADRALDSVEAHLVSEPDGLIRLLTPPFDRTPEDPGYIKGYIPGVRENGGQYTHAALWVVKAMAEAGRNNRAARLLDLLNPIHHTRTPEEVSTYEVEPYVIAADVYGAPPHVGKGGWSWYTGSAGWMYRVGLESILGLSVEEGRRLRLRPCVPDDWPEFRLDWRPPGGSTVWEIHAVNPLHSGLGVASATLDGRPALIDDGAAVVDLVNDGATHRIELVLGARPAGR